MVVYIRQSKLPSEVSINKYNAQVGAYLQGEEVILYQSFSEIKELTSEDIVVDYIMETRALLKMMGLNVPVYDYPIELKEFYGRKIYAGILGEIVNIPDNWGKFIKPKAGSKVFTGRVVNGTHDLIGIGLPFDYPIWISEVVEFIAEWRCFVLDGRVLDVRPYIGVIIGDIVGSVYEWNNIKTKDFPLFRKDCFFTDDTVMTCAVAEAIMNGGQKDDFIDAMKKYGRMYPNADYGARFNAWLNSDNREPYNSFGNGSAMRISPCAWIMDCGFYAKTGIWPSSRGLTSLSAEVTHNHPEGVKGAMATVDAIFLCRFYFGGYCREYEQSINDNLTECKRRIKDYIEKEYDYNLSQTLDEIRPNYRFNETCQETVPQAIIAFLESRDFEDAIRNAISLGGDSDTLAAITCSIAEAAYGIPD
ncbi:hydrolase [Streptococcus pneumoniae]|nr:hydrolase [Streptococcus pneumoniae]